MSVSLLKTHKKGTYILLRFENTLDVVINHNFNSKLQTNFNGVFPKWNEFTEFKEFDKSLKHELGSI